MNIKRLLTAVIGFPIVALIVIFGNKYIMDIIFAGVAIIAMKEYINCVSKKASVIKWISYVSVVSIAILHIFPRYFNTYIFNFGIPFLLLILFLHVIITNMKITFEDITYTFFGIMYILGFIAFLPLIYGIENPISGKILIWFVIISAWGTDTFAYLVGKNIGKIKFSKVSPNKSIEGCIGGTLGAVILNLILIFILNNFFEFSLSYLIIGLGTLILSIIGQIGDFSASVIKRYFEVKDFSELFPGHGGMLDRIDSVMVIAPFAYFLLTMFL